MFFNFNNIEQVSPDLALEEIRRTGVVLLDVREVSEYQQARIAGSMLFPLSLMAIRENDLDDLKDSEIIVYCHVGNRSMQASRWLNRKGFKVKNLTGGIVNWMRSGYPVESGK